MTISYTDFELDILKYEFTIRSGNRTVAALKRQNNMGLHIAISRLFGGLCT